MNEPLPSPSGPPLLTEPLLKQYLALSPAHQAYFKALYRQLWLYVLPYKGFTRGNGVISGFYAVYSALVSAGVSFPFLVLLTYLDHATNKRHAVTLKQLKECRLFDFNPEPIIREFGKSGYIDRTGRDPQRYHWRNYPGKPYIMINDQGRAFLRYLQQDIYNVLMRTAQDQLTGYIKKPGKGRRG
ncbi:MAG: hypothetical protein PHY56_05905 [Candidatus Omnitrophica bacterium]|jgi:hypothetical protein|nr:hypothetical protein [Candidatus Omnitrophota bacterium]